MILFNDTSHITGPAIKKLYTIALIFSLSTFHVLCQSDNFPIGTRPAALSNAYVMESDVWSVHHNQAGLGFLSHFNIGFHHENKFVVPEFSLHAIALTIPSKPGTIGFSYSYFGYSKYNESKIGLGIGRKLGNGFAAGIQLNYHYTFLEGDYDNRNALTVEGGITYKPTEKISLGAHLFNPTRSKISPNDQDAIPTSFRAGIGIKPFNKFFLAVEAEKPLDRKIKLKTGLEYQLFESLFLRAGVSTNPLLSSFGLGYTMNRFSADIAFSYHDILGFTPHFSFQVRLG